MANTSMSSPLRIKIEYSDSSEEDSSPLKFVYLIASPATTTINKLISTLQDFISTQFSRQNVRLVHLITEDGYLLMKHDICSNIIINNEKLMCLHMNRFVVENVDSLDTEKAWLTLEDHDSSDDTEKSLNVGINNTGKFYVYLFGGENNKELYLFNIIELLSIASDKRKEADHLQMKISKPFSSDWFVEAEWEQDSGSNNTLLLVGNLKTGDNTQVRSGKLRINLNKLTKTIEKGEVTHLSDHAKDNNSVVEPEQEQARFNQLKEMIPPPKRTGPTINTTITPGKIDMHECEGDSAIRMIQGSESSVKMMQEMNARDGSFRNFVSITNIIISKKPIILPEILSQKRSAPVDKPISIVQVNVQYQRHDGKWVDCQNAKLVLTSSGQKIATSILNIEPDKLISVYIEAAIQVKGEPNRIDATRCRAHRSLTQPLKLKIILIDTLSKTCSLTVEQINEPLKLITREIFLSQQTDDIKKLISFVYADDCEYDERIYTVVYINNDDCLVIGDKSNSAYMEKSELRTLQRNAKKSGKTEAPIEFINNSKKRATSIFDPETFLLYAIRIELTTTTSQTVETVLLPLDEIK